MPKEFSSFRSLSRRTVIRGAGVSLCLPLLDAMQPALASATESKEAKRFVGVSLALGLHNPNLVPETDGRNYKPSRYLAGLDDLRNDFTVVSGTSHPGVSGGHSAEGEYLFGLSQRAWIGITQYDFVGPIDGQAIGRTNSVPVSGAEHEISD